MSSPARRRPAAREDDPVAEQPGVEVEGALGSSVGLEHGQDQRHGSLLAVSCNHGCIACATRRLHVEIEQEIVLPVPREGMGSADRGGAARVVRERRRAGGGPGR